MSIDSDVSRRICRSVFSARYLRISRSRLQNGRGLSLVQFDEIYSHTLCSRMWRKVRALVSLNLAPFCNNPLMGTVMILWSGYCYRNIIALFGNLDMAHCNLISSGSEVEGVAFVSRQDITSYLPTNALLRLCSLSHRDRRLFESA